jgi:hypothetical protein
VIEGRAKREIASIFCDLSLMISEYVELLTNIFKLDMRYCFICLLVEPISGVDLDKFTSFEERKDFIFIGNFT